MDRVFSFLKHHFQDFLEELEYTFQAAQAHPERIFLTVHQKVESTARLNRRPDSERCEELLAHFRELKDADRRMREWLLTRTDQNERAELVRAFRRERRAMEESRQMLTGDFPTFSERQRRLLSEAMEGFGRQLERLAETLSETPPFSEGPAHPGSETCSPSASPAEQSGETERGKTVGSGETAGLGDRTEDLSIRAKMGEAAYRALLQKKLGVSLDELLSWYQEEREKTRQEVFSLARTLDIPGPAPRTMKEVADLLFQYEPPCQTPEEMLERANTYLKRTRALAHAYVCLPEDESCACVAVPRCCKDSYPWGGYAGGDFRFRPMRGQMFLNVYNYQHITDGWIKLNSLHEAYPGHHVQYVRTVLDPKPATVKLGAKRVPLLEGTCLRTERAFEDLFSEDPFFPLFVAYRRHHASVRICADLMLFYEGASLAEVVELYEQELGLDRRTARGQVQAHQNEPGYFTCYYYGMKKLCSWEKEYGFLGKDYTELLFSAGYISIERFEELLQMTPEEREQYFRDFASLIPDLECQP